MKEKKDSIKQFFSELLKNNNKNLTKSIKNLPENIISEINKKFPERSKSLQEKIYLIINDLHPDFNICNKGNKKRFISLSKGYKKFCKLNCECMKEYNGKITKEKFSNLDYKKKIEEKRKETLRNKFGVENPSLIKEIVEKRKETFLKRYGVENPSKLEWVKDKKKRTCLNHFGVEHHMKVQNIKEKRKETFLEKYGETCPTKCIEIKEKAKRTNLKKYGVDNPMKAEEIKRKSKETLLKKYGVDNIIKLEQIQNKIKRKNKEKFGVEYVVQSDYFKEKSKNTLLKNYGVDNPMKSEEIKNKKKLIYLEKYGIENVSQLHIPKENLELLNNKDWLIEQYINKKKTIIEISEILGVIPNTVFKRLQKFGIKTRAYNRSRGEKELCEFFSSLGYTVTQNTKEIIKPFELDIYLENSKIAIEYCGLFWHNEKKVGKDYHVLKFKECEKNNIRLITLFSDEWIFDKEKTKRKILDILENKEENLFKDKIGEQEILVDARWSNGKILENFGYKLKEFLPQKRHGIYPIKKELKICDENDLKAKYWIWDCGWFLYEKNKSP